MPLLTARLLPRLRTAILAMLLVVLPLQSSLQLVAGLQGPRHVHTDAPVQAGLLASWRLLLERLHAAPPPPLRALGLPSLAASPWHAPAWHAHGGRVHRHGPGEGDALPVADADGEGGTPSAATVFLAWLPAGPGMAAVSSAPVPVFSLPLRPGRTVAPEPARPRA